MKEDYTQGMNLNDNDDAINSFNQGWKSKEVLSIKKKKSLKVAIK